MGQTIRSPAEDSLASRPHGCAVHLVQMPGSGRAAAPLAARVHALLCAKERARMATLRSANAAWEYACSHAALRLVVGRSVGVAPNDLALVEPGKAFVAPRLRVGDAHGITISLSHSAPHVAIAVGWQTRIGIDIERTAQAGLALESRDVFMTDDERRELDALPAAGRGLQALRTWCMKEAALKAIGAGLSLDPREFSLRPLDAVGRHWSAVFRIDQPVVNVEILTAGIESTAVVALAQDCPAAVPTIAHESLEALFA